MNLIEAFKAMSDLTADECKRCRYPHSCCSKEYCEISEQFTKDFFGETLPHTNHPTLPFMGPNGCTIAPHHRPLCTLHTCEVSSFGVKRGNMQWTEEYFRLRTVIDELIEKKIK